MNILYIAEGLDRSESDYIARMHQSGHQVEVMLPPQWEIGNWDTDNIPVQRIPLSSRRDAASIKTIRTRLQRGDIDIIHALRNNRPLSNALVANRKTRIPLVAYRGTVGHLSRWNPGSWLTYLNPRIACITCVSDAVRTYLLKQGVPKERLRTVYKGHDPNWYQVENQVDLQAQGVPNEAFVICCAANMRPVKGIDVLVQALHHLPESSRVHLLLVGKVMDDRLPRLFEDPEVQPRIHLAGFQENAPEWAASSQACVMASIKREGLPRAVIESMSQGIPPIVTDVGGMPELVEDEISGLVVPPSDPKALAEAMLKLEQDTALRQSLGQGALARIEGPFSIERTVEELLDIYQQVSEGHNF